MGISLSGGPYSYNRFDAYEQLIAEKQGYNDREDESLGERDGKESTKKQSKKDRRDEAKGEAKSEGKPDYIDIDKDGDKEESMKKAAKEAKNEQMDYYTSVLSRLAGTYHPHDPAKDVAPVMEMEKPKQAKKMSEPTLEKGLDKAEKDVKKEAFEAGYRMAMQEAKGAGSPAKMVGEVKKEMASNKKETDAMKFADKKQRREQAKNALGEAAASAGYQMPDDLAEAILTTAGVLAGDALAGLGSVVGGAAKGIGNAAGGVASGVGSAAGGVHKGVKKAAKAKTSDAELEAEEVQYVLSALIENGLASNEVSAEVIMTHMSQDWYDSIIAEMGPAYPSETKAQAKAQSDHREGKSSAGLKTGKNPGPKMSHTSGANKQA